MVNITIAAGEETRDGSPAKLPGEDYRSALETGGPRPWDLLTGHGAVLFYVALHPTTTMREVASACLLTERRVSTIIKDLCEGKYISVSRLGRRNAYDLNPGCQFRHRTFAGVPLKEVVNLLIQEAGTDRIDR